MEHICPERIFYAEEGRTQLPNMVDCVLYAPLAPQ